MLDKMIQHLNEPVMLLRMHDKETNEQIQKHTLMTNGALYVVFVVLYFGKDIFQLIAPFFIGE